MNRPLTRAERLRLFFDVATGLILAGAIGGFSWAAGLRKDVDKQKIRFDTHIEQYIELRDDIKYIRTQVDETKDKVTETNISINKHMMGAIE